MVKGRSTAEVDPMTIARSMLSANISWKSDDEYGDARRGILTKFQGR